MATVADNFIITPFKNVLYQSQKRQRISIDGDNIHCQCHHQYHHHQSHNSLNTTYSIQTTKPCLLSEQEQKMECHDNQPQHSQPYQHPYNFHHRSRDADDQSSSCSVTFESNNGSSQNTTSSWLKTVVNIDYRPAAATSAHQDQQDNMIDNRRRRATYIEEQKSCVSMGCMMIKGDDHDHDHQQLPRTTTDDKHVGFVVPPQQIIKKRAYGCMICGEIMPSLIALKNHFSQTHADKMVFSCESCQERFFSEKGLARHKLSCTVPIVVSDSPAIAPPTTAEAGVITAPVTVAVTVAVGSKRVFACEQCDASFGRNRDLKRHVDTLHNPLYHCRGCDLTFYQSSDLNLHHIQVHLNQKTN